MKAGELCTGDLQIDNGMEESKERRHDHFRLISCLSKNRSKVLKDGIKSHSCFLYNCWPNY